MTKQQIDLPYHNGAGIPIREPLYESQDNVMYKPDPVCGCGCGKWSADGFETEHGDYIYSKECYYKLSIQNGWLKEVS